MERNYYPLLEDFLADLKSGKHYLNEVATADQIASMPKLSEQSDAKSPYTGKIINVKAVAEEVEKAKYKIVTQSPLYRPYVHEMSPTIYTWVIETMATDGVRLFVNPEFAAELSWMGKIFVLIHEIMHCILMHDQRGGGFEHDLFNQAADFEINAIIVDTTDDFDEKFVKDEIHGLYEKKYLNMPVEEIYRELEKNPPKLPPPPPSAGQGQPQPGQGQGQPGQPGQGQPGQGQPGQGQPGQGQGQGQGQPSQGQGKPGQGSGQGQPGQGKPGQPGGSGSGAGDQKAKDLAKAKEEADGENKRLRKKLEGVDRGRAGAIIDKRTGEQIAAASGYDPEEAREGQDARATWEANAREIVKAAEKLKAAGTVRGDSLIKSVGKLLRGTVNWKSILKQYVGTALSPEKEWRIGAKKHLHKSDDYLKRGLRAKKDAIKKVVVCVDTSGSMFVGDRFDKVLGDVNDIIFSKKIKEITVIFFDTSVDPGSVQTIKRGQKVWRPKPIKAGGGTYFQPPLDWIKHNLKDAVNLVVFISDGANADTVHRPKYANKFIWLIYDDFNWKQPFGKVIKTNSGDM